MRNFIVLAGLFVFSAATVNAEMKVWYYLLTKDRKDEITKNYVRGLGEGILEANTQATLKGIPLYCQPEKLALTTENYIDMIDRQIETAKRYHKDEELRELGISMLLMLQLLETFPCSKK